MMIGSPNHNENQVDHSTSGRLTPSISFLLLFGQVRSVSNPYSDIPSTFT